MSQEKAQLIAPEGTFTVPGLNVAGVVTGGNFVGNVTGTASRNLKHWVQQDWRQVGNPSKKCGEA